MTRSPQPLDLVAIGRSSVDLYGEQVGCRLEDMSSFAKYVGGSPTNTVVGAARLGLRTALVTRVGNDHFGRFIREQLAHEGVDVGAVRTDPDRLTALAVLGVRDREHFPLIFFRNDCADMAIGVGDVDAGLAARAGAILINGTHLSRPGVFDASIRLMRLAREAGARVVFDIDYRPVLWGLTEPDKGDNRFVADTDVSRRLQMVIGDCDLIVGTEEEFRVLGGTDETIAALKEVRARTAAMLVCKVGSAGCVIFTGAVGDTLDTGLACPGFPVEVFNVLGAGDAFMAGFLSGWLAGAPLAECGRIGNACGAIVVSRHGCAPAMPTAPELADFLDRFTPGAGAVRLRADARLNNLHWSTTRARDYPDLKVLAFDHRRQLLDLTEQAGVPEERIGQFKQLCLRAVDEVAQGDPSFGVLIDVRLGRDALQATAEMPYWVGRPIELPGSCPLTWEDGADAGSVLRDWPAGQVVKCLVFYHPDDAEALRLAQEAQITRLFEACRASGHELLLEVIASKNGAVRDETTARIIERIYDLGIYPDWWKLEPLPSDASWRAVDAMIGARDPLCRGVVLLGLSQSIDALLAGFAAAAPFACVKGFAVGRTVFEEAARDWLRGAINDDAAVARLKARFGLLVEGWRRLRPDTSCVRRAAHA